MLSSTWGQMEPCCGSELAAAEPSRTGAVPSSVISSTGTSTVRSNFLVDVGATMVTGAPPAEARHLLSRPHGR